MDWVRVTQKNTEIRIANNGHLSHPIITKQGLAQGCSLSPFLFTLVIETFASFVRRSTKLQGLTVQGYEKRIGLVADDCLLTLKASTNNFDYLHTILQLFSQVSGLRINHDKSVLIHNNADPAFLSHHSVARFRTAPMGEGMYYLGTWIGNANVLAQNYVINPSLMEDVLKSRPHQSLTLSGRILQVKALAASKYVYKFMLLPTPSRKFLHSLDKTYYDYIWDNRRHKLSKKKMERSHKRGGFNMLNVTLQNSALKLGWINRFLSDPSILSITQVAFFTCGLIPIIDLLRCNVDGRNFQVLIHSVIPTVLRDTFKIWFNQVFVKEPLIANLQSFLSTLFCFNQVMSDPTYFYTQLELYRFLAMNNVYTVQEVVTNLSTLYMAINMYEPKLCNVFLSILRQLPIPWAKLMNQNPNIMQVNQSHIVYRFASNLMPVKACYLWLRDANIVVEPNAENQWAKDLNIPPEEAIVSWEEFCGKANRLRTPVLKDFHLLFANRAFILNNVACKFKETTENCNFCDLAKESYVHVFYECLFVQKIWEKCRKFYTQYVDDSEDCSFSKRSCLLSDFNSNILIIMSVLIKRRIFLARLNEFPLTFLQVLKDTKQYRDTHWRLTKGNPNNETEYKRTWSSLVVDTPFEEQILIEEAALL